MATIFTLIAGFLLALATSFGVVAAVNHSTNTTPASSTPLVPYGSR
jgi:hypothetical protein